MDEKSIKKLKPEKARKTPLGWVFRKNRVFSNPAFRRLSGARAEKRVIVSAPAQAAPALAPKHC